ncbi:hypothetical protein HDU93_004858 [Gonapodya sp. JEL0774]|nr:hypothetical protein HDU93_004858 [Gonapodya sp. JEL0774]
MRTRTTYWKSRASDDSSITCSSREVATITAIHSVLITDGDLKIVAEGPDLVIHYGKDVMDGMNEWCIKHHGESGLTEQVISSSITLADAQSQVLEFLKRHVAKGQACLAGNTVHMDKMFMIREFPEVVDWLHYRIVDVSTLKELVRRWYPDLYSRLPAKKLSHRAMDDIRESVEELRWYRRNVLKKEKSKSD